MQRQRTKLYFKNRKGQKKGLLIISCNMNQQMQEGLTTGLNNFIDHPTKIVAVLNIPRDARWQYIRL